MLFKKILLGLLALIIILAFSLYLFLKAQAPKYSGELQLSNGVKDSTLVIYDTYAIPHIYAKSETDAFFALGYAHAQERLFQMDLIRRLAKGELAEILGPKLVTTDKMMRTLSIKQMADRSAAAFRANNGPMVEAAQAYINGVNSFINKGRLAVEFTILGYQPSEFTLEDSYCNLGFMALGFTMTMKEEPLIEYIYRKLGDEYLEVFALDSVSNYENYGQKTTKEEAITSLIAELEKAEQNIPIPLWEGSNNWAMAASRSKSGKALLANDTHIKYGQPSVWFEADLDYPGGGIYGYFLAGVPFPIMGHNERLGWGLTIFPLDNMDMYSETQNPNNKNQYRVLNQWKNYEIRKENIKVKGEKDVEFSLRFTRHGPVLNDAYDNIAKESKDPVSLWWVLNKIETKALEATYQMMHARDIYQFEKAMPKIDILGLNVVYADSDDNIAWWACALIPKRPQGLNPKRYIDGANDTLNHMNFYDFKDNPQSINPPEGYIVTANNAPAAVNGLNYPGYYAPGYRAQRLKDLIEEQEKWDIESMKRLQTDNHSNRDKKLSELVYTEAKFGNEEQEMMLVLDAWDGNYDVQSKGAIIYNRLLYFILKGAMEDELGVDIFAKLKLTYVFKSGIENLLTNENSLWWDNVSTDEEESRSMIFSQAVAQTYKSLTKQLTPDMESWAWGKVHQLEFVHPIGRKKPMDKIFNLGPFPVPGGNEVVDKEAFVYGDDAKYQVISGPAMRLLMDFSKPNAAIGVIPTGQSGNFMSPHYSDQLQLFLNGKYRPQINRRADIPESNNRVWFIPAE